MSPPPDVLELLLPGALPPTVARARRLTTFLRLLATDARPVAADTVRVDLEGARAELERHRRLRVERAHRDLLAHHLAEALGPESFARPLEPLQSAQESWRRLEEMRGELPGLPDLPAPGEPAAAVAARLLEATVELSVLRAEQPLWAALLRRVQNGPEEGARAFRELLEAGPVRARSSALAGLAACLLDRREVRAARTLLEEHGAEVRTPRLMQLRSWARLAAGEDAGEPPPVSDRFLPLPLAELRERRPEWLPWLAGRVAPAGRSPTSDSEGPGASRREVGASFLGVFALRPGGAAHPVHLDAGAALAARVAPWLRRRDGACRETREPEHRLVVRAQSVIEHRRDRPLRGALCPERAASLALVPVPDSGGEAAGWLHLEFEHHLLPSEARLARLAALWRARVLEARPGVQRGGEDSHRPRSANGPVPGEDPRSVFFQRLLEGLGMKTAQRSWWGFVTSGDRPRPVASGGGRPERGDPGGGARALDRAVVTGGVVRYEEPDPRISFSPEAMSGIVVPLISRGGLVGLLCVESTRRRDFGDTAVRRLAGRLHGAADELRVACFRAWHLRRFGFDVHAPARGALFDDVLSAARASAALTLTGPPGSGKDVVARWVHHESCGDGPLDVHAGAGLAPERGLPDGSESGTLLLQDVERLDPRLQAELTRRLERECESPSSGRMIVTLECTPSEAAAAGCLPDALARRLERFHLRVPSLALRRDEIPDLVSTLLARFAQEERADRPRLDDGAVAALWRQPWQGNVRELEHFVYRLVVTRPRGEVGVALIERLARHSGLELVRRVPSRRPDPAFVRSALRITRTLRGGLNKTRAAAYLGWDPDTLVARMKELGLDASVLADE